MTTPAPHNLTRKNAARPLARALALVALLCFGALQVQEAGHWHEPGDSYAQCLLCKSSSAVALPADAPVDQALGLVAGVTQIVSAFSPAGDVSPFLARGPPLSS